MSSLLHNASVGRIVPVSCENYIHELYRNRIKDSRCCWGLAGLATIVGIIISDAWGPAFFVSLSMLYTLYLKHKMNQEVEKISKLETASVLSTKKLVNGQYLMMIDNTYYKGDFGIPVGEQIKIVTYDSMIYGIMNRAS